MRIIYVREEDDFRSLVTSISAQVNGRLVFGQLRRHIDMVEAFHFSRIEAYL